MTNNKTLVQAEGEGYEEYVAEKLKSEFDKVMLWKKVPKKLLEEHGIFIDTCADIGIDIIAIKGNKCTFIQCKNYTDNVRIEDLAGFMYFMFTYNKRNCMLCYSNDVCARIKKDHSGENKNGIILRKIPFDNASIEHSQVLECKELRYYQKEAVDLLSDKTLIKCVLAMPCGLGKTFTASAIVKGYDTVILLAPLKKLTADLLKNMGIFLGEEYGKVLLSSDKNGLRDIENVKNKLSENVKNIIGSTYDSVDILVQLINELKNPIIIVDEFHNLSESNLTNKKDNIYKILNMGIKTIYMSATPKEINYDAMYKFEWNKATAEKLICDFNIIIPTKEVIENDKLKQMIELCKDLRDINNELEPVDESSNCKKFKKPKKFEEVIEKYIKKAYFIIRSLLHTGNTKCIVYLTTIKKAKMFEKIIEGFLNLLNIDIKIYTITNRTSVGERENSVYCFRKNNTLSLILNVQILNEGVDIPECDSVFVTQPNKNKDNLIQRMCRCNRITETKNSCNMYLWTSEKNANEVLKYISNNTNEYTRDKINIYNPIDNMKKRGDKGNENIIENDNKNRNNSNHNNVMLRSDTDYLSIDRFEKNIYSIKIENIILNQEESSSLFDLSDLLVEIVQGNIIVNSNNSGYKWDSKTKLWKEKTDKILMIEIANDSMLTKAIKNLEQEILEAIKKEYTDQILYKVYLERVGRLKKYFHSVSNMKNIYTLAKEKLFNEEFKTKIINRNHDLLPIAGGLVIDLITGAVRDRIREDFFSFECPVNYVPEVEWTETDCNNLKKFIDQFFIEDKEYIQYMKIKLGSYLSGRNSHDFDINYGCNHNGKNALFRALEIILGKFCGYISKDVIVFDPKQHRKKGDGSHTDHLIPIEGKRLVFIQELEENDLIDSEIVKKIISGDTISGVRSHYGKKTITIEPFCKLSISANKIPKFDVDDAMIDRANFYPFKTTFLHKGGLKTEKKSDHELEFAELFLKEKRAINVLFSWLVQGCIEYYRVMDDGIPKPKILKQYTQEKIDEDNIVFKWVEEKCNVTPIEEFKLFKKDDRKKNCSSTHILYESFSMWAEKNNCNVGYGKIKFYNQLSMKFNKKRNSDGFIFERIQLKNE